MSKWNFKGFCRLLNTENLKTKKSKKVENKIHSWQIYSWLDDWATAIDTIFLLFFRPNAPLNYYPLINCTGQKWSIYNSCFCFRNSWIYLKSSALWIMLKILFLLDVISIPFIPGLSLLLKFENSDIYST